MTRANNHWINHIKMVHRKNPHLSYSQAMRLASKSYRKQQHGEGIEQFIDPIADFGKTLVTSIIGTPELQKMRTQARIDRRKAKDAERARKKKR